MANDDVTRAEFEGLRAEVMELKDSNAKVVHLVAGGLNMATGEVDKGLIQTLDELGIECKELVKELGTVKDEIKEFFKDFKSGIGHAVRILTPLIGSAILGVAVWVIHTVWPWIVTLITHHQ